MAEPKTERRGGVKIAVPAAQGYTREITENEKETAKHE
jgi:hypothetical protein